jgi:hypothetical protein
MHVSERLNGVTTRSVLVATLIGVALVGSVVTVSAASDPTRPTSDRHALPPDDGGSGGGGGGGGVPERRVALGLASPMGRDMSELDSLTSMSGGRKPAMWVVWSQWGNPDARDFPTETVHHLRGRGVIPIIWWEPVRSADLSDPTYARHQNIIDGDHDAYILQFARDAKAYGNLVILRFAQEANASTFPWGVGRFDNTPQTFVAAWRHVHGLFESVGADNVKFLWSVSREHCAGGCNPYTGLYPGDAYVDALGFSGYNWGAVDGKTWTSMYDLYRKSVEHMRDFNSTKPIFVAETGSGAVGGDKAAWIRDGYREVYDRLPDISAIVYLHADLLDEGHRDWRLTNPPEAMEAYAEIAGLDRFTGRSPFSARARLARIMQDGSRRADRDRKEANEEDTTPKPRRQRAPLVHRGSADAGGGQGDGGGQSWTRAVNRESKRRKADDEPPASLGSFSR